MPIFLLLALAQPPTLPPPPSPSVPEAPSSLEDAQTLHAEGTASYEAADYLGAIEKFTAALNIVMGERGDHDDTKLALLYNIARAHEKAHEIDRDPTHLRQALALYKRYEVAVAKKGDLGDQLDVAAKIKGLEKSLRQMEHPAPLPTRPPPPAPRADWKKPRNVGIALVTVGSAEIVAGVIMAVVGSRYEPNARAQVQKLADRGIPMDHPAWAQGAQFIKQEQKKGRLLMGLGGGLAGIGAVTLGTGTFFMVKAKRTRLSARVSPTFLGIQWSGKF